MWIPIHTLGPGLKLTLKGVAWVSETNILPDLSPTLYLLGLLFQLVEVAFIESLSHNYIMDSMETMHKITISSCMYSKSQTLVIFFLLFYFWERERREGKGSGRRQDKDTEKPSGPRCGSIYFSPRTQEKLKQDDEFCGQPKLHSEFKSSLSYRIRAYIKKLKRKTKISQETKMITPWLLCHSFKSDEVQILTRSYTVPKELPLGSP